MIKRILDKIESKRDSKNSFDKVLVFLKDFAWFIYASICHNNYPRNKDKIIFFLYRIKYFNLIIRDKTSDINVFKEIFIHHELDINIENPKIIIDCGAYVGYSTYFLAKKYPNARIYAIEPEKSNFDILKLNTHGLDNVTLINKAIYHKKTNLEIVDKNSDKWGFQVVEDKNGEIEGITIEDLMKEYGFDSIDILKVDIEGSEKELFKHNKEWVDSVRCIMIELHDRLVDGCLESFYKAIGNTFKMDISGEKIVAINDRMLNEKKIKNSKIHIVYFSCKRHLPYLLISLKSLIKLNSIYLGKIYLYIDEGDYVDEKDIIKLNKITPNIILRKTDKIIGHGEKCVLSESKAFNEVSKEIGDNDYIAKTDSDIIFLNDTIFHQVLDSDMDLVGREEDSFRPFTYVQGGLYFIRSNIVPKIIKHNYREIIDEVLFRINANLINKIDACPEDGFFHLLISKYTDKILFIAFMNTLRGCEQSNPSVLHFIGIKDRMKFCYHYGEFYFFIDPPYLYFWKITSYIDKILGKLGSFLRGRVPSLYKLLKPYFPDKK